MKNKKTSKHSDSKVKKAPPNSSSKTTSKDTKTTQSNKLPKKKLTDSKIGSSRTGLSRSKLKTGPKQKRKKKPSSKSQVQEKLVIVGIGASAGGLEAIEGFFSNLAPETGMAFVVVTHQAQDHPSLLPELLRKYTERKVLRVEDGMKVDSGCIYINPPGLETTIKQGVLNLSKPEKPQGLQLPIDTFFRSLAEDKKEQAIAIVLSGMGADGTLGIKAVKGALGMTMAQDPASATFPWMPQNAIDTGQVDFILPPNRMPEKVILYASGSGGFLTYGGQEDLSNDNLYRKIFHRIQVRTGHDFSFYKTNTLQRRIERRMNFCHISNPLQYINYLQKKPEETDRLFKDLLIGVTSFFRNPETFNYLQKKIIPKLLKGRPENDSIRIWVPGCSSGEEVYSLAIILRECLDKLNTMLHVKIFGTDLDGHSIDIARAGKYPEGIANDIDAKRLNQFFTKDQDQFQVRKDIREMVIFAPHNLIKDPPFLKLDLVSCRNLLIYIKPELQNRVINHFHYALKPEGILFLGSSETVGTDNKQFKLVGKNQKIYLRTSYLKNEKAPMAIAEESPFTRQQKGNEIELKQNRPLPVEKLNIQKITKELMADQFAPPGVLINEQGDIFFIHGKIGAYFEVTSGKPNHNIFEMARQGLQSELFLAVHDARTQGKLVKKEGVRVKSNGGFISVNLTVQKIKTPKSLQGMYLVALEQGHPLEADKIPSKKGVSKFTKDRELEALKNELQYTREALQSTIEELETSNEEMQSTNEELQSANEELQSSNEEIETSREEMESLNEELQSTNTELQVRVDELTRVNDDMTNLLNSIEIATLFLDNKTNLKRYTEEAKKLIHLIPSDVGRPIGDIATELQYENLVQDAREVLRTLIFKEMEIQTKDGIWYRMRIMPYRTSDNVIDGLVITLVNIDLLKNTKIELEETRDSVFLSQIVKNSVDPIIVCTFGGDIVEWNKGAEIQYGFTTSQAMKMGILDLVPAKEKKATKALIKKLKKGEEVKAFRSVRTTTQGKKIDVWVSAWAVEIIKDGKSVRGFAVIERDISNQDLLKELHLLRSDLTN